jgi:two-component system, OmpR family, sensor kinase
VSNTAHHVSVGRPLTGTQANARRPWRRWYPQTLRWRLTLTVVAAASVLLVVSLGALYTSLNSQLHASVDEGLRARLQDLIVDARIEGSSLADPYAQIVNTHGHVIVASAAAPDTSVLTPSERGAAERGLVMVDRPTEGMAGQARLAARAVPGTNRIVVAGTSLSGLEATTNRLLLALAFALPVLLILLAAVLAWAIHASLRPVAALTKQAARVSTAGSDQRLPQPPGNDEIAELASTLNAMLDRLRLSFERERAFVDDASHELRTPLAVLRGELELALLDNDPVQMRRAVEIAQAESEHLSNLAVDLLVLARQRAGTLGLDRSHADLRDMAEETAQRLRPVIKAELGVVGESQHALVDVTRMDQVLTNLATNAFRAGAQRIQVAVTREGDSAVLEIEDDGPGFPDDLLHSAFDRFTRGEPARTRRGGSAPGTGAGLGLPITAAIVRAHGGDISVTNDAALGGARIRIRLPLRDPVAGSRGE